jgi:putative tryptophan/tyrosine transport system substrate-binding protein
MRKFLTGLVFTAILCVIVFPARAEEVALVVGSDIASFAAAAKNIKDYLELNGHTAIDVIETSRDSDYVSRVQAKKYKVICVLGTNPFKKIKDTVKDTPLVFSMVLNLAENGLSSGADSGQNFTGVSLDVPVKVQFEIFKKIVPRIQNVGVLYTRNSADIIHEAQAIQSDFGVTLIAKKVESSTDVPNAIHTIGSIDALWIVPDVRVCTKDTLPLILSFAAENKLPILGYADYLVKAGALAAYTYDYADIGIQTGEVVLKVLNSQNAGAIAVTGPRKVGYMINAKTLKYFGIDVSSSVLKGADQLYE